MPTVLKRRRALLVQEGYDLTRLRKLNENQTLELLKAVQDKVLGPNCLLCNKCKMPYIKKHGDWTCMMVDCIHPCPCKKN